MPTRVTFEGDAEMAAKIAAIGKKYPNRILMQLNITAEKIMTISKRLVPVDFGILKTSGLVEKPEKKGKKFMVTMGYGGAASAYALVQHENLSFAHTVGQAKYLEEPLLKYDVKRDLIEGLQL